MNQAKEQCHLHHVQDCGVCDDFSCGDNLNKDKPYVSPAGNMIFRLNEFDWWAGPDMEEAIEAYMEQCDMPRDEACDDPRPMTCAEVERYTFFDDLAMVDESTKRSFKEELQREELRGVEFPCFFASTEY